MNEEWVPSSIFQDEYMVSNYGRVLSKRTGKILKPATDKCGYHYYVLCVNGNRKTVKAHRLVALTFIENGENKPAVDHINGDRQDNRAINLRWVTNKENSNNPLTLPKLKKNAIKNISKMIEESRRRDFGRKPVRIIKDGNTHVYPSLKSASWAVGISEPKLSQILNGHKPQRKNMTVLWEVSDDQE